MKPAVLAVLVLFDASTMFASAVLSTNANVQQVGMFCDAAAIPVLKPGPDIAIAPGPFGQTGTHSFASFGRVSVQVDFIAPSGFGSSFGSGSAKFVDTLTFFGGSGQGSLLWVLDIGGCLVGCTKTLVFPTSFVFGEPLGISAAISVSESGVAGSRVANFSVFNVLGLVVKDATGAPVGSYYLQTEYGHDYGFAGAVPVPEPATWLFTMAGVAGLGLLRLRGKCLRSLRPV